MSFFDLGLRYGLICGIIVGKIEFGCVCALKYGSWKVGVCPPEDAVRLEAAGFSPLAAAVLCGRGVRDPEEAKTLLRTDTPLYDPFLLTDMDQAVNRIQLALECGERIAVYGDYDVDGITSTCLLIEYLRGQGGDCIYYIPGRIEEGYGLNRAAVAQLAERGANLIITVDCGITALEEARYCKELGLDLIVTDHHECKGELPEAVAVVDPFRPGDRYPNRDLAGVGVAFKLAAALSGSQEWMLDQFCELLCLGTVADVMPMLGENRVFVAAGLRRLTLAPRLGLAALMHECGCDRHTLTAGSVGYVLSPRINAAGRMGDVDKAVRLFLAKDPAEASAVASELCQLNRRRQSVEAEIYEQAVALLNGEREPDAIVLAGEFWHQGVVGIVASRLAEEYRCPTFLICLDGDRGKASSRSYGGFNLFATLESLSDLLESFGGHELAAGFTIARDRIDEFREAAVAQAAEFRRSGGAGSSLTVDCAIEPALLTMRNVAALEQLEPCGTGCPRPVFMMDRMIAEQVGEVGHGRHLRLRLRRGNRYFTAIFFSVTAQQAGITAGDAVEVAFTPQVNEFRGSRSVQLNVADVRLAPMAAWYAGERELYERCSTGWLSAAEAERLLPERADFVALWRYLLANAYNGRIHDDADHLSRSVSARTGRIEQPARTQICLDVFAERGLIALRRVGRRVQITLTSDGTRVDLERSAIMIRLKQLIEETEQDNAPE